MNNGSLLSQDHSYSGTFKIQSLHWSAVCDGYSGQRFASAVMTLLLVDREGR
jgi:hypothetical protein